MKSQLIDGSKSTRLQLKIHPRKKVRYCSDDLQLSNSSTMLSCHSCRTGFLSVKNSSLNNDEYSCENCRMKNQIEEKIVLPFSFNPKKNLQLNGFRKNAMKFPTASNGQTLIQPSGEIKFRPTTSLKKSKCLSSVPTNLKRKRTNSSSLSPPPPLPSPSSSAMIDSPWQSLYRLFHSCQSEEFHGPKFSSKNSIQHSSCFICRKSSNKHSPFIHCDYCPLIYHLTCLRTSFPPHHEKWMCPNHNSPLLDRYLARKSTINDRVKIPHRYAHIDEHLIIQDFTSKKSTNTIQNYQFEPIDISQIPKSIKEFYSQAKIEPITNGDIPIEKIITNEDQYSFSSTYDPSIWDLLQSILDDIVHHQPYEFSSTFPVVNSVPLPSKTPTNNTLDTIDTLLQALSEPNLTENHLEDNLTAPLISSLIDLTQFHSSHAALIHRRSKTVIYLRKYVIWFGLSTSNDICLESFHSSHLCSCISERHACLYYDQKRNQFELLNYSEYGTIVNNLRYGISSINEEISCTKSTSDAIWDGPVSIEQGTVIKIGCHEFLFYRHLVR